jgi:SAM-dependent methyltransferase
LRLSALTLLASVPGAVVLARGRFRETVPDQRYLWHWGDVDSSEVRLLGAGQGYYRNMRDVVCPICNGRGRTVLYGPKLPAKFDETAPPPPYSAHYQINRCANCGLTYSSPVMDDRGVSRLYQGSSEINVSPGEEDNVRRTMALYYRLASPHLRGRERVLDIGCDMGFMLEAAKTDGFKELHGVEPVPAARSIAETIEGTIVTGKFFEQTHYPADYFDLITLIHVLDHLYDPRVVLRQARKNLRPEGLILAVVHNVRSLLGLLLGERFPIFNLYHHYFFNKDTLAELFRRQGYEVVKVMATRNCYSLGFFAQRLPGLPGSFQQAAFRGLQLLRVADIPITIPIGNIGIVARRLAR